jgi:CheY-like chemotaxis protein
MADKEKSPVRVLTLAAATMFDGIAATKEIRSVPELAEAPIVAVIAHGQYYREEVLAAGCTTVIDKPIVFEDVGKIISRYLAD